MKEVIFSENAPKAIGPYSQATLINGMLFISGQVPVDAAIGKVVEGGIVEQTHQVLKNINAILKEAGYTLGDVVKTTCLLKDMDNFSAMNEVYASYFDMNPPARAAFGVKRLPLDAEIEIEAIAVKNK